MYRSLLILIPVVLLVASPVVAQQTANQNALADAVCIATADAPLSAEDRLRQLRTAVPESPVLLVGQLAEQLRPKNIAKREQALKDIILYATNYGDLVDLNPLTADLFRVFSSDSNPGHRIMAAHAISLIGDSETNMQLMRMAARDGSPEVRRFASYAAASVI